MNIWLIVLLVFFVYTYAIVVTYLVKEGRWKGGFFKVIYNILITVFISLFFMAISPLTVAIFFFGVIDGISQEGFDIKPLNEEKKVSLSGMGFKYNDEWLSNSNFIYSGHRKNIDGTIISVANNGRCSVFGTKTKEVKFYIERIKALDIYL